MLPQTYIDCRQQPKAIVGFNADDAPGRQAKVQPEPFRWRSGSGRSRVSATGQESARERSAAATEDSNPSGDPLWIRYGHWAEPFDRVCSDQR